MNGSKPYSPSGDVRTRAFSSPRLRGRSRFGAAKARPSLLGRGRKWRSGVDGSNASRISPCIRLLFPLLGRNDSVGLGGTANLAVLCGNLPPSLEHHRRSPFGAAIRPESGGLVARQYGQVARATPIFTESLRLGRGPGEGKGGNRYPKVSVHSGHRRTLRVPWQSRGHLNIIYEEDIAQFNRRSERR